MPREPKQVYKADLDRMLKAAQGDPEYSKRMADSKQRGLQVVAARGKVKFCFRYRPPSGGHRVMQPIDEYPAITLDAARRIAQERRIQVAGGKDPRELQAEKRRRGMTVRQAVEDYLAYFEGRVAAGKPAPGGRRKTPAKRSSLTAARRRLVANVLPKLGDHPVLDLSTAEVDKIHTAMKETPVEANRSVAALSAVYGWLQKQKTKAGARVVPLGTNPTAGVDKYTETGRVRDLTTDEVVRLGEVMRDAEGDTNPVALRLLRFLLLTGWRSGEAVGQGRQAGRRDRPGLRWGDLDLDRGLAFLRDTKAGQQTRVIGAAVVDLLRDARPDDADPDQCVFPGDPSADRPYTGLTKVRRRLFDAAGIEATAEGRVVTHSTRHTFASVGADVQHGRYAGLVGPLLGHSHGQIKGITARYVHQSPENLRPAADAIAGELARLLGLVEPGEVVAFPGRKGTANG